APAPVDLRYAHVPVQLPPVPAQLRRDCRLLVVLAHDPQLVEVFQRRDQQLGAHLGESGRQLDRVLALTDGGRSHREDRPVVELLIHLHDRHARLSVAGKDRVRHRRGAAPARQQRGHGENGCTGEGAPVERRYPAEAATASSFSSPTRSATRRSVSRLVSLSVKRTPSRWSSSCWNARAVKPEDLIRISLPWRLRPLTTTVSARSTSPTQPG